ncbi:MAG: hypothetical protein HYU25_00885 [Candidatus Rokubacteria bacterium]|nr:hypothetical protein [Candidatus Rokubacteria bacterium]
MTYGYRPENWPVFEAELRKRRIVATDIEKVEIRPEHPGNMNVTVTLRSGRVESWRQPHETTM